MPNGTGHAGTGPYDGPLVAVFVEAVRMPRLSVLAVASLSFVLPLAASAQAPAAGAAAGTLTVEVDATDLQRNVFHTRQRVPVVPGPLTLLYPQWIQGNHSPTGPIEKLAGLTIQANGQTIPWTRDPLNVYAFKLTVPDGVGALELRYDVLAPTNSGQGRVVMTPEMLNLQWNTVALYPAGVPARDLPVSATLKLPAQWQASTALEVEARQGDTLRYRTVPLDTLLDSPVFAGRHYRQIDLDPGAKTPVRLNIIADDPKYLDAKPEQIDAHRRLVTQAYRLFGAHHYDRYDFLFALTDQMGHIGLEHHRSSENGVETGYFTDWDNQNVGRDLLAHEFTHSWNGKYRRPAGLVVSDFNTPLDDSLLWVYEGQTQYWGFVLTGRSGLWSQDMARDAMAQVAAVYTNGSPGFGWRNVQDTTNDPVIAQRRPLANRSYQLSEDYYSAGQLIWLAVDTKLRELSGEKRSLDDFAQAFFGGESGRYDVSPYRFDDVVRTLNGVVAYDWASFLRQRLDANAPPLDGIAASGWRLVYTDQPSPYQKQLEGERKALNLTWSLGMSVANQTSTLASVIWDSPAFAAGLTPGTTLLAVNGRAYDNERMKSAIATAKDGKHPIELIVKDGTVVKTVRIDYREGMKYPKLERIPGTPDRLSRIFAPK